MISLYTIIYLNHLNNFIESVIRQDSRIIKTIENALDDLYSLIAADDKYLISGDADYYRQFRQIRNDFAKRLQELSGLADTRQKKICWQTFKNSRTDSMSCFKSENCAPAARSNPGINGRITPGKERKSADLSMSNCEIS